MQTDSDLTGVSQPVTAPNQSPAAQYTSIQCPYCGSVQFFGGKKVTALGWALYIAALVNIPISLLLMFLLIGFLTIFLTPLLAIVGFYGCRKHVNTCARCKREF